MIRPVVLFLLDPLTQVGLLALLGAGFAYRGKRRAARWCLAVATGWLVLVSATPLPQALVHAREKQYRVWRPAPNDTAATHVLVLGGGHTPAPDLPATDRLSDRSLARLVEGIRIYRQLPNARLVCSGFSATGSTPIATTAAHAALSLGVPPGDTLLLTQPHNTEAEARAYAARFGTSHRLILVTSALHLPRALRWFRAYGLRPVPAPADHLIKVDPRYSPYSFGPGSTNIELMDRWLHETVGTWWARIKTSTNG